MPAHMSRALRRRILGLGVVLFGLMIRTLVGLVHALLAPTSEVRTVIAEVLFMLVMVELVRLHRRASAAYRREDSTSIRDIRRARSFCCGAVMSLINTVPGETSVFKRFVRFEPAIQHHEGEQDTAGEHDQDCEDYRVNPKAVEEVPYRS
jgi:hypothetical protein